MPFDASSSSPDKSIILVTRPAGPQRIVHVSIPDQKFVVVEGAKRDLYERVEILGPSRMVQRTGGMGPSFFLETEAALDCFGYFGSNRHEDEALRNKVLAAMRAARMPPQIFRGVPSHNRLPISIHHSGRFCR